MNTYSLPAVGPFVNLKEDDRSLLASYGEFIPVQAEGVLIHEGDIQPNLYCVLAGELQVQRSSGAEAFVLANLFPGESVGEMAIFDQAPASATVVAVKFSQVWRISYEQFMEFVGDNPTASVKVMVSLLSTLSKRLRQIDPSAFRFAYKTS